MVFFDFATVTELMQQQNRKLLFWVCNCAAAVSVSEEGAKKTLRRCEHQIL